MLMSSTCIHCMYNLNKVIVRNVFVVNCLEDFGHMLDIDDIHSDGWGRPIYTCTHTQSISMACAHIHMSVDSWPHRVVK